MTRTIQLGQHDQNHKLNGIGRIVRVWAGGGDIWEGHFVNNELDGFGRWIKTYQDGEYACYAGRWKAGLRHGFGRLIYSSCPINHFQGLWENDNAMETREEIDKIEDYDPEKD